MKLSVKNQGFSYFRRTLYFFLLLITLLMSVFAILPSTVSSGANVASRKNVLVVHSYNQGFAWTDELHAGIISKLSHDNFNIYTEYLDAYRVNPIEDYKKEIIKSYSQKNISYIVVTDNDALNLILSLKDEYFKNIPVLFAGINGGLPADMKFDDVRGILQNVDYSSFLNWLGKTMPQIENVIVCGADTDTTTGTYSQLLEAYNNISHNNIKFDIHIVKIEDYKEQLFQIKSFDSNKTAIYSAGSFGVLDHRQYTEMLSSNTSMPTFCGVSSSISGNVIGGFVISPFEHGSIISDDLVKLSEGASIDSIPIIDTSVQELIFNYNGLKAFNIDEKSLPEGSTIINKPDSFFVLTLEQVVIICSVFIVLIFIITALLVISMIRKKANLALSKVNTELSLRKTELENSQEKLLESQEELKRNYNLLIASNARIQNLLDYNQLTGIMYDTKFFEALEEKFRYEGQVTLINIALTNLQKLTLTHGKEIYESILTDIAFNLNKIVGEDDLIGLTSNNNFLIATTQYLDEDSKLIQLLLSYFEKPLISDLFTIFVKFKIGIAHYPLHSKSFSQTLQYSSLSITTIIDNQLSNVAVYSPEMLELINKEIEIKTEIEVALAEKEFILYFQPKYAADRETLLGLEALIRWNHKDGSIKSPGYFIDIAEQSGQIINIGFYVIEEACRTIIEYNLVERNIPVAINLSGHHFASMDIVEILLEAIKKYNIPPHILELEITETTLIKNREFTSTVLKRLHDIGFMITLDDFGTGYASLNYIKDLPIDKIKIDQSFTNGIDDPKTRNLVKSMIQMAHELYYKVTVEGVEKDEHFMILKDFNPQEYQGYLFRRPCPIHDIFDL